MTSTEVRRKFLDFFEKRGHKIVPSSSLVPDDPSVLLTTAGMQQFKLHFTGDRNAQEDFHSLSVASCQKSFRTSDIDEVGDGSHLTFFEMLGNFSFGGPASPDTSQGGYFKKEAITWAHEFITKEMGLAISYVSIFEGKESIGVPKDEESRKIWQSLDSNLKIVEQGVNDVFWGPTGSSGPCGPTTEIYVKNAAGYDVEVWNIVFNQYFYPGSREELLMEKEENGKRNGTEKKLEPLKTPGVDTGMGLDRLVMVAQGRKNIFETDLFEPIISAIRKSCGDNHKPSETSERIIADHFRGSFFLIADGVLPSNVERGYVLRRLLRRAIRHVQKLGAQPDVHERIFDVVARDVYHDVYPELEAKRDLILNTIWGEWSKFTKTLDKGLKEFEKAARLMASSGEKQISGKIAFELYTTYGFPIDLTRELATEQGLTVDIAGFQGEMENHIAVSSAGQEKKFGGHGLLLDTGELKARDEAEVKIVTRLHTATHLLQQALRDVLGNEVRQAGSDITAERTRFDFTFGRKLTPEEIAKVEARVNEKIKEDLPVAFVELPRKEAEKTGALFFSARGGSSSRGKAKYGDVVKVYYIGKDLASAWSKEFCGGPHVSHTSEVGKFRIAKEEAVSAGVRRIRGVVEP